LGHAKSVVKKTNLPLPTLCRNKSTVFGDSRNRGRCDTSDANNHQKSTLFRDSRTYIVLVDVMLLTPNRRQIYNFSEIIGI
jgi:hypothetical protein